MRDIVYIFIAAFIIVSFLDAISIDDWGADINRTEDFTGYVVVNKDNNFWFRNRIEIKKDSLSYRFKSDDIVYQQLQIGDTLKVKRRK